jgi:hypothetical protein
MARRALIAGDIVAAVDSKSPQRHIAEILDKVEAIRDGVLLPHRQYEVVWSGRESEARTSKRALLIGLPGDKRNNCMERVRVRPSAVRLWNNPKERRQRLEAGTAQTEGSHTSKKLDAAKLEQ